MIPKFIVIHHSDTKDGPELSWNAIRKYHVEVNGWKDIGYHAGVELVGSSYEILWGRPWDMQGAHTVGYNDKALGICLVGNWDIDIPPEQQLEKARVLVRYWMRNFNIPKENVKAHKELNSTDCPGKNFDIQSFRNAL